MRVEALGLRLGRDPVREGHHDVGGEHQALGAHEIEEGRIAGEQRGTVLLDEAVRLLGAQQGGRAAAPGEHEARLLEGLAGGSDHEGALCARAGVRREIGPGLGVVPGIDLAARKHQRARGEVDLVVAHHHEHLEAGGAVAQDDDGGGRPRLHRLARGLCCSVAHFLPFPAAGSGNSSR